MIYIECQGEMMVFLYDNSMGLVKIIERGSGYYVYKLKRVIETTYPLTGKKRYKFIWETKSCDKHGYQPYENDDLTYPETHISDIKRNNPSKITKNTKY